MFEVTNQNDNQDIIFINKIIDLFGRSPTSMNIDIDRTLLGRFSMTISGNRDGLWTISEDSIYPGGDGPTTARYKFHNGKWYKLEEGEEFKEIN